MDQFGPSQAGNLTFFLSGFGPHGLPQEGFSKSISQLHINRNLTDGHS